MTTVIVIILALILLPLIVLFVKGFIEGWRETQTPQPGLDLWYELVYQRTPKPKPTFRVICPQDEGDK